MTRRSLHIVLAAILGIAVLSGCQTAYYAVWEKLGKEKRHLLRDNVEAASKEQVKASESFKDVLTRMKEMYGFEGGPGKGLRQCSGPTRGQRGESHDVHKRVVHGGNRFAADLFREWKSEINEMKNQKLKAQSTRSLGEAKKQYARLHDAMVRAESRTDPVLAQLKDNVLYLKHNLNAQAVGALKKEAGSIQIEIDRLIKDMQASIAEADHFLKTFK
jgi:hypothetical protein